METNQQVRVLRKYANRKLYDLEASGYVTAQQTLNMYYKHNGNLQVIDHVTGRDITAETIYKAAAARLDEYSRHAEVIELARTVADGS